MFVSGKKQSEKKGLPPGSLVFIGEEKSHKPVIKIFDYDQDRFEEREERNLDQCMRYRKSDTVTWVNIDGVHDVELIREIGQLCDLHPLLLEDVLNTAHRPKLDEFEEHLFVLLKMIRFDDDQERIRTEQVSLVLGKNFVLSFHESQGDVFESVRDRLRHSRGRIRRMGADYLAYCLIDAIVDEYFNVLEKIDERIERLEDDLMDDSGESTTHKIYSLKKDLIFLLKAIWPLREMVARLEKGESELVSDKLSIFLRDLYDHIIQVMETIESYRDVLTGLLDTYLSAMSNRMNTVMKMLTVIATIFIPLTFIVGIYGMNFEHMPELHWHWGYPTVLGLMAAMTLSMLIYFRRKYWI
ncbi:MAG: magnesium/cobalt transporter CorA [Candidatus Glassbacteria bacterium]